MAWIQSFSSALRERKVYRTAVTYVAAMIALWGAAEVGSNALGLPPVVLRFVVLASLAGLPISLLAAWFVDVRLEGDGERQRRGSVARALSFGVGGGLAAFLVLAATVGGVRRPTDPLKQAPLGIAVDSLRRITHALQIQRIAMAPDGRSVAFVHSDHKGIRLGIQPLDGSDQTILLSESDWSPLEDGWITALWWVASEAIGFSIGDEERPDRRSFSVPVRGGPLQPLQRPEGIASNTGDRWVAISHHGDRTALIIRPAIGSSTDTVWVNDQVAALSWAPDDQWLVFATYLDAGTYRYSGLDLRTERVTRIADGTTRVHAVLPTGVLLQGVGGLSYHPVDWAREEPVGATVQVAAIPGLEDVRASGRGDLALLIGPHTNTMWLARPGTPSSVQVVVPPSTTWFDNAVSPDGTRIAGVLSENGEYRLVTVDLATSAIRAVSPPWQFMANPRWSPNGRYVAVQAASEESAPTVVYDASARTEVARSSTWTFPNVSWPNPLLWRSDSSLVFYAFDRQDWVELSLNSEVRDVPLPSISASRWNQLWLSRVVGDLQMPGVPSLFSPDGRLVMFANPLRAGPSDWMYDVMTHRAVPLENPPPFAIDSSTALFPVQWVADTIAIVREVCGTESCEEELWHVVLPGAWHLVGPLTPLSGIGSEPGTNCFARAAALMGRTLACFPAMQAGNHVDLWAARLSIP